MTDSHTIWYELLRYCGPIHTQTFSFPRISNNMVDTGPCEVGMTLTPPNIGFDHTNLSL